MVSRRPVEAFSEAGGLASRILADEAVVQHWQEPSALEGFSIGGLAGHLYAAMRRFEVALDEAPPASPRVVGLAEYYGANRIDRPQDLESGIPAFLRDDGEQRARHGAEPTATRFRELVARLEDRLTTEPPDRLVSVVQIPNGVSQLDHYVATRVVELVVHSDDLAHSVGLAPLVIPPLAASVAIEVFVELARARVGDLDVVRAFTRAERATEGAVRVL